MRILMVSNWLPPIRSGSAYYTSSLAESLIARGHEVRVVTLDWQESCETKDVFPFTVYKLPVIRLPKLSLFYNLKRMGFAFTPGNFRKLKALVREYQPDVLHHVNHIFDTTFLTTWVGRSAGIPVVGSITTPIQHQSFWKQRIFELADRITVGFFGVRHWNAIVSLDQTVHHYVGQVYGKKVQERSHVIPFGVPLESMPLYENHQGLRSERPQILMVGHIHPFRNPAQLVRAMPAVLQAVPNARLILAGRVDLQEPIKAAQALGLKQDQIQFLEETPHDEIIRLMKTSHVFAMWATGPYPSLGTATMEAMLCETPAISNVPENLFGDGKLRDRENILIVDTRDPAAIAQAIIRLLKDKMLWSKIGAGGRCFVLDHLSWESIAIQMEKLYARVKLSQPCTNSTSYKFPAQKSP